MRKRHQIVRPNAAADSNGNNAVTSRLERVEPGSPNRSGRPAAVTRRRRVAVGQEDHDRACAACTVSVAIPLIIRDDIRARIVHRLSRARHARVRATHAVDPTLRRRRAGRAGRASEVVRGRDELTEGNDGNSRLRSTGADVVASDDLRHEALRLTPFAV